MSNIEKTVVRIPCGDETNVGQSGHGESNKKEYNTKKKKRRRGRKVVRGNHELKLSKDSSNYKSLLKNLKSVARQLSQINILLREKLTTNIKNPTIEKLIRKRKYVELPQVDPSVHGSVKVPHPVSDDDGDDSESVPFKRKRGRPPKRRKHNLEKAYAPDFSTPQIQSRPEFNGVWLRRIKSAKLVNQSGQQWIPEK